MVTHHPSLASLGVWAKVLVYILTHGTLPCSVIKIDSTHTFWLFEMSFQWSSVLWVLQRPVSSYPCCCSFTSGLLQSTQPLGQHCEILFVLVQTKIVFILLEVFQTLPPPQEAGLALSDCYQTKPRHSITGTGWHLAVAQQWRYQWHSVFPCRWQCQLLFCTPLLCPWLLAESKPVISK